MALDTVEVLDLIALLVSELKAAMADSATPGKITPAEWAEIASRVGIRAFQEAVD